ncbi:MAG: hypothetical protein ABIK89_00755, partial [Planctomycetota bacterium]
MESSPGSSGGPQGPTSLRFAQGGTRRHDVGGTKRVRPEGGNPMVSLQAALLALAVSGTGDTVLLDFYADWCG